MSQFWFGFGMFWVLVIGIFGSIALTVYAQTRMWPGAMPPNVLCGLVIGLGSLIGLGCIAVAIISVQP